MAEFKGHFRAFNSSSENELRHEGKAEEANAKK